MGKSRGQYEKTITVRVSDETYLVFEGIRVAAHREMSDVMRRVLGDAGVQKAVRDAVTRLSAQDQSEAQERVRAALRNLAVTSVQTGTDPLSREKRIEQVRKTLLLYHCDPRQAEELEQRVWADEYRSAQKGLTEGVG